MPKHNRLLAAALLAGAVVVIDAGVAPVTPAQAAPRGWKLPHGAREVAPDVFEISSKQVGGETLVGYAILDHGHRAKPSGAGGGGGGKGGGGSSGYAYIAGGFKWKSTPESYVVDSTVVHTGGGWNPALAHGVIASSIAQWEDAANGTIGDGQSVNILGNEVAGLINHAQIGGSTNGVNEVCFDGIDERGVIAVTFVWGVLSGPSRVREILEWDQMYDDDGDVTWGDVVASGDTSLMDFPDIAIHEIGHALGMDHPNAIYVDETMYAFADDGETTKRDLHDGDIAGINGLY